MDDAEARGIAHLSKYTERLGIDMDLPNSRVSQNNKYPPPADLSEMEIRLEMPNDKTELVKYYVVVFCGVEPQPQNELDDENGLPPVEPLSTSCIVIELGRAFANLGVDLVYANTFVSPTVVRADLLAIHEIWHKMSKSDKATLKLLSPKLSTAIELMTPAYAGDEWLLRGEQSGGDTQDSEHSTPTVKENKERQ